MTPIRIDALKGMDSSVIEGMSDNPVSLTNVVHTRDGGYRARPGKVALLSGLLAFRQFSVTRYAYVQTADESRLYDLQTGSMFAYPTLRAKRDVVVYGDRVVVSGSESTASSIPKFGASSLDSFVGESTEVVGDAESVPAPSDGIYSNVVTQSVALSRSVYSIIEDIRLSVSLVTPSGGSFVGPAPSTWTGAWVHNGVTWPFTSGAVQMILVCFRLKVGYISGTSMNPGDARPTYLQNQFLVALPDQPKKNDGTDIYGPYYPVFTFSGVPSDYEPVFYTSTTDKNENGYGLRGIPFYAAGNSISQYQAVRMITPSARQTVWYKADAGAVTLPASPPEGMQVDDPAQGSSVSVAGSTFVFRGYALDEFTYNDTPPYMSYSGMYQNMTGRAQMGAPLHLMAQYIQAVSAGGRVPAYNPMFRWLKVIAYPFTADSYTVENYPDASDQEAPLFSTFFPVGSRAVFSAARIWVAPDYSIMTTHDPIGSIADRHKAQIVTRAMRDYAASGPRTVFYSEPNSLEFNEQFIVPPFRKSRNVTALAATSAGVVVFGEADGVLISGDSLASFRATAIDIPGASSQATVAQWRGAIFYCNRQGMYMLADGSGAKAVSNPVTREWGSPISMSVNDGEGSILVSFSDKTMLHYDIQRDAWSKWTEPGQISAPTNYAFHMTISGSGNVSKLTGEAVDAEAEFVMDGGATDVRKHWDRVSYRREGFANETVLSVKAGNKAAWKVSSTTTSQDSDLIVHRINEQSSSLRLKLNFTGTVSIGGPLTVNVKSGREDSNIKD